MLSMSSALPGVRGQQSVHAAEPYTCSGRERVGNPQRIGSGSRRDSCFARLTAGSRPALRRVDVGTSGPLILPGFFIGLTAGALVLTSLYNGTGGSILAVAVWHAS